MLKVCEADVIAALGQVDTLILKEIVRTQASIAEFTYAIEFLQSKAWAVPKSFQLLNSRMQRLVDLICVTGVLDAGERNRAA